MRCALGCTLHPGDLPKAKSTPDAERQYLPQVSGKAAHHPEQNLPFFFLRRLLTRIILPCVRRRRHFQSPPTLPGAEPIESPIPRADREKCRQISATRQAARLLNQRGEYVMDDILCGASVPSEGHRKGQETVFVSHVGLFERLPRVQRGPAFDPGCCTSASSAPFSTILTFWRPVCSAENQEIRNSSGNAHALQSAASPSAPIMTWIVAGCGRSGIIRQHEVARSQLTSHVEA